MIRAYHRDKGRKSTLFGSEISTAAPVPVSTQTQYALSPYLKSNHMPGYAKFKVAGTAGTFTPRCGYRTAVRADIPLGGMAD